MAKPRQAISSELIRKISTSEIVAPSSSSTEKAGNWSPAPPSSGSSASAAIHSAAEPKIGNRYHLKPTRQMKMRPRRERSEEHTSELQSRFDLVCRLLLEKKK